MSTTSTAATMTRVGTVLAIVFLLSGIANAAASNTCSSYGGMSENDINATSCTDVITKLTPCLPFVQAKEDKPSTQCCGGAKALVETAKTKQDRQAICDCIKTAGSTVGKFDPSRITQLVKDCGLKIKLPPISSHTDCSKVTFYHEG